jgi:hypothetical protein
MHSFEVGAANIFPGPDQAEGKTAIAASKGDGYEDV